jgi:DNA-binding transcriptional LysR family regulator
MMKGPTLDVRRLLLLHELSVRGTLAEVARSMHLTPSAVSQQLSQLEREAGVELLRKVGRGVQLTADAEALVAHTRDLLDTLERAEADLRTSLKEVAGTVRIAVFQSAALALMPAALAEMRVAYPRLRIEMTQHEPETALRETWARGFDLVVAEQYPGHAAPHHPGVDRQLLISDPIRLAVPPGWMRTHPVRELADVAELPWVMEPAGTASRHSAEQACRRAGFEPDVRYESADLQVQIALIESGNAVALMPDLIWGGEVPPCDLWDPPQAPHREIFTSARVAGDRDPALAAVRATLHRVAAAIRDGRPPIA